MKLKYYLRGLGAGIFVSILLLRLVPGNSEKLTDAEIKERAAELGMVEESDMVPLGDALKQDDLKDNIDDLEGLENKEGLEKEVLEKEGKEDLQKKSQGEPVSENQVIQNNVSNNRVSPDKTSQDKVSQNKSSQDKTLNNAVSRNKVPESEKSNTALSRNEISQPKTKMPQVGTAFDEAEDGQAVKRDASEARTTSEGKNTSNDDVAKSNASKSNTTKRNNSKSSTAKRDTTKGNDVKSSTTKSNPSKSSTAKENASKSNTSQNLTQKSNTDQDEIVVITIRSGQSSRSAANACENAGLVEDATEFDLFMCNGGYDRKLKAGSYQIQKGASQEEIAKALTRKN